MKKDSLINDIRKNDVKMKDIKKNDIKKNSILKSIPQKNNPIIWSDYPDPDVIRVDDTYYMISTTMHFMPGGVILRSFDLINWEILTYVYEELDHTDAQCLVGDESIYGKGMWAASLRYHKEKFYVCFVCNDTGKTYLFQSKDIMGPWEKQTIKGFYHDCSLLFDEDDRVYIVSGNSKIQLTELNKELTEPKVGGISRVLVEEKGNVRLGYEGAHFYKINGKYYLFLIHWPIDGFGRRTEACFVADSIESEFIGKDVLDDDMNYHNLGVAQGGIVDTPQGEWYAMCFQDHGAIGRIPVLIPVRFENDFPVFGDHGKISHSLVVNSTRPEYVYKPLWENDDFEYTLDENGKVHLKNIWQWNHTPDYKHWSITNHPNALRISSGKLSPNVTLAANTLTQRMVGPVTNATVTVDGSLLKNGDFAGICALQGCYRLIALTKENDSYFLVIIGKEFTEEEGIWGPKGGDRQEGKEYKRIPISHSKITLKLIANFEDNIDEVEFFYEENKSFIKLGETLKLYFRLDHFTGCRVGLFMYSTKTIGGTADFSNFLMDCSNYHAN